MDHPIMSAPARLVTRTFAAMATAAITLFVASSFALAQQPPAPAPAKPAAAPKPAPAKPPAAKPAPAKPAEAPAAQAQPNAAQPNTEASQAEQMPPITYSEWVKFCVKQPDGTKQVCLTGIDGRVDSGGVPIVALVVIEPEGEPKKVLRATLPVGMSIQPGTRLIIDQNQPFTAAYVTCFNNGCMSDYELTPDILAKLKKGQNAIVQGIGYTGGGISIPVPLAAFAKVFDGPPTDLKVLEERNKKLEDESKKMEEELQRKAAELAKQKAQAPAAAGTPAAPAGK
jgi:invasion protein IalB